MITIKNATVETTGKGQAEFVGEVKQLTLSIGDYTWTVEVPRMEFDDAMKGTK